MSRLPAVADRFYPGNKDALDKVVNDLLIKHHCTQKKKAIAVVSPHAGYIYSGGVCAETLNSIIIPETVMILGPNHHGRGASIALSRTPWQMPSGTVQIDEELAELLLEIDQEIKVNEAAHQFEHSLEVQVPFLQALQENLRIVPLALSHLSFNECETLGESLAVAIRRFDKPVLVLASSDMNHFDSREIGSKKDKLVLAELVNLQPQALYSTVAQNNISMCGVIPVTIALQVSLHLGASIAELIRYTDSGDVSGDIDQVVGYAGAILYRS
ncbi:MAG: AmmeMemoRadiSam system protein B [Desulfocapsaceae bacterium]|nr:AmmeMemoRadiSam system protein B [Desulfocapsaceae bacterium]